jgi:hypothetical protein
VTVLRIPTPGAGPVDRFAVKCLDATYSQVQVWWLAAVGVVTSIVLIITGLVMGGDSYAHQGKKIHWDLIQYGVATLAVVALFAILVSFLANRNSATSSFQYRSNRNDPMRYTATDIYWKLTPDNRQIAKSAVNWIIDHDTLTDSVGNYLYYSGCKERLAALNALLKEQAATENALTLVSNDDILSIKEYTQALADARKTYTSLIG